MEISACIIYTHAIKPSTNDVEYAYDGEQNVYTLCIHILYPSI